MPQWRPCGIAHVAMVSPPIRRQDPWWHVSLIHLEVADVMFGRIFVVVGNQAVQLLIEESRNPATSLGVSADQTVMVPVSVPPASPWSVTTEFVPASILAIHPPRLPQSFRRCRPSSLRLRFLDLQEAALPFKRLRVFVLPNRAPSPDRPSLASRESLRSILSAHNRHCSRRTTSRVENHRVPACRYAAARPFYSGTRTLLYVPGAPCAPAYRFVASPATSNPFQRKGIWRRRKFL